MVEETKTGQVPSALPGTQQEKPSLFGAGMPRISAIIEHPDFQKALKANKQAEENRPFCRHDWEHSLAVARIAYILWLEKGGTKDRKEEIYAAALLHDIGRFQQYKDKNVDHAHASVALAKPILMACGFDATERNRICTAMALHRQNKEGDLFCEVLYYGDKLSRTCFTCAAIVQCNWRKKNEMLVY